MLEILTQPNKLNLQFISRKYHIFCTSAVMCSHLSNNRFSTRKYNHYKGMNWCCNTILGNRESSYKRHMSLHVLLWDFECNANISQDHYTHAAYCIEFRFPIAIDLNRKKGIASSTVNRLATGMNV